MKSHLKTTKQASEMYKGMVGCIWSSARGAVSSKWWPYTEWFFLLKKCCEKIILFNWNLKRVSGEIQRQDKCLTSIGFGWLARLVFLFWWLVRLVFLFGRLARLVFAFWVAIENDKGNLKLYWPFPLSTRKLVDFLSPTEWGSKTVLASGNWWVFGF